MKQYKPEFLGKVIPEKPPELKNFLVEKYDQFNTAYDVCKNSSEQIDDVENAGGNGKDLTIKVTADDKTMVELSETAATKGNVTVQGNSITVSPANPA